MRIIAILLGLLALLAPQYQPAAQDTSEKCTECKLPESLWQSVLALLHSTLTDPVAFFTMVLCGLTAFLALSTLRAANAAKDATKAIPLIERGRIFVLVGKDLNCLTSAPLDSFVIHGTPLPNFTFKLQNAGKTPAIIRRVVAGAQIGHPSDAPDYSAEAGAITIMDTEHPVMAGVTMNPLKEGVAIKWPSDEADLSSGTIEKIRRAELALRFYTEIEYSVVTDNEAHITRWYWVFNATTHWLEVCNQAGEQYNKRT